MVDSLFAGEFVSLVTDHCTAGRRLMKGYCPLCGIRRGYDSNDRVNGKLAEVRQNVGANQKE
jgi:hypothetical protein